MHVLVPHKSCFNRDLVASNTEIWNGRARSRTHAQQRKQPKRGSIEKSNFSSWNKMQITNRRAYLRFVKYQMESNEQRKKKENRHKNVGAAKRCNLINERQKSCIHFKRFLFPLNVTRCNLNFVFFATDSAATGDAEWKNKRFSRLVWLQFQLCDNVQKTKIDLLYIATQYRLTTSTISLVSA